MKIEIFDKLYTLGEIAKGAAKGFFIAAALCFITCALGFSLCYLAVHLSPQLK